MTDPTTPAPAGAYTPSPTMRFAAAVNAGDLKTAEAALKDGADIDASISDGGANVLMKAVNEGSYDLVKWSITHGAEPNIIKNSSTPLIRAVDNKQFSIARFLLDNGADANFPEMKKTAATNYGYPKELPLHRAAYSGNEPMARLLLRKGADIDATSRDGANALWYAATNRRGRLTNILLDAGASPDGIYDDRNTPVAPHPMYGYGGGMRTGKFTTALHEYKSYQMRDPVVYEEKYQVNRALLDAGADVHLKDSDGKTARQLIAPQEGGERMADMFAEYEKYRAFDPEKISTLRRKDLFSLDTNGNALMDSPSTWRHLDAIANHLKKIGEPLRMEDFHAKNTRGKMWLERGVECFAVQDIIKHVAPAHEAGSINKLFKATRMDILEPEVDTMPDALRAAGKRLQLNRIFTPEVWDGRTKNEIRAIYAALPNVFREDVTSYQQIQVDLPNQRPTQGKGIGRYELDDKNVEEKSGFSGNIQRGGGFTGRG